MRKKALFIVIAFVLLGLLALGGLYRANRLDLGFLRDVNTNTYQFVQNYAYQAGTQAANDYAKKYNATNTDELYDTDQELYTQTINLDVLFTNVDMRWKSPDIYRLFRYLTAYLNAGGDPNYIIKDWEMTLFLTEVGDASLLQPLILRTYSYTFYSLDIQEPFFPKPFMDFITLLHEKGYTNWNYTSYFFPDIINVFKLGMWAMQTLDMYDASYDKFPEIGRNTSERILNVLDTLINYGMDPSISNKPPRFTPFGAIRCRFKLDAHSNVLARSLTGTDPWVPLAQADPVNPDDEYDVDWKREKWREVQKVIKLFMAYGAQDVIYDEEKIIRRGPCEIPTRMGYWD